MRERESGASIVLHPAGEAVGFGAFRFDRANRILSRHGVELSLPPRVLGVLEHLVARPGSVVSKQALMDAVWKDAYVTETSLTEAVSQLRQALGDDPQQPSYVQTVHRRGYRFVAPVTLDTTAALPLRLAEKAATAPGASAPSAPEPRLVAGTSQATPPAVRSRSTGLLAAVAVLAIALAVWSLLRSLRASLPPLMRTAIPIAVGDPNAMRDPPALLLTADGTAMLYTVARGGSSQLYVRAMDRYESVPLAGTEGAAQPFISPDGQWVGFFADGKLKKVPLVGGSVATVCDAADPGGGSWGDDGTIVFANGKTAGLFRVSARGGRPESLTTIDPQKGELAHWWPEVLPGSRAVVFTVWPTGGLEDARLALVALRGDPAEPRIIVKGGSFGRYAPTGHLVFARKSRLMAIAFDPRRDETSGDPVALFDGIAVDWFTGAAQFAFSRTGALAYLPGTHEVPAHSLVAFDSAGKERVLSAPTRPIMNIAAAPDGRMAAVTIHEGKGSDIWLADVESGALTRLTFEAHNIEPAFTPDGRHVTFASSRDGPDNLFWVAADGTGTAERLLEATRNQVPDSWSPDGRILAFTEFHPETGADIWLLPMDTREPRPFLRTRFDEEATAFSPDGRFVAYGSNETNKWEVFVRPFPAGGPRWQVSTAGGYSASWSPDGRELYYRTDEGIWVVPIETTPTFRSGPARRFVADKRVIAMVASRSARVLAVRGTDKAPPSQVNLVLGWFTELTRLAGRAD